MKVLHVIASLSPVYGGPSAAVIQMCDAIKEAGADVELAATDADGNRNAHPQEALKRIGPDIPVHIFPRKQPFTYMYSPAMSSWLSANTSRYDLVHVHALFSHPTTMACRQARKMRIPYLVRPLGLLDPWCLNQKPWRKRLYWLLADRTNLKHAAALHFTSETEAEESRWIPAGVQKVVLPLGAPDQLGPPDQEVDEFRSKYGIPPGSHVLLFLSRIDRKKGLDLLVPALGQVRDTGIPFTLLIAGPDQDGYRAEVESMIRETRLDPHVRFLGMVEGSKKESLLKHSDVFVLPSYQENFAIAAVEAIRRGLPVLISDRVGIHPYVTRYQAGSVAPCRVDRLTSALTELMRDAPKRRAMGRNAVRLAEQEFRWPRIARRTLTLYEEITANHRRRDLSRRRPAQGGSAQPSHPHPRAES